MNPITQNLHALDVGLEKNRATPVAPAPDNAVGAASFRDVLGLQFSKHAALRLNARNITLTDGQMERVASAVSKAGEKGIRDSLVLVDNVALVVNVKSRTVITAMNQANENVFSNIDGAVII